MATTPLATATIRVEEQSSGFTAELQRRLDDNDSGREPTYSDEEIRAKVKDWKSRVRDE